MKTKNLFQSILPALIVVVLIVSIVTATVLLSRSGLPDVKGEVNADELFGNGKVFYSLETVQQFDIYIERFIKNLLNSFDDFDVASLLPELSVGALGEQLRLPFKNAGIASDKVLAFGRYLSEIDPQFSLTAVLIVFCDKVENPDYDPEVDPPEAQYKYEYNPNKDIGGELFDLDYVGAVRSVIEATALTTEEIARIFYEWFAADPTGPVASSMTRDQFVVFFGGLFDLYAAVESFVSGTPSYVTARATSELIYEQGMRMRSIIDEVGIDAVVDGIGLGSPVTLPDLPENVEESPDAAIASANLVNTLIETDLAAPAIETLTDFMTMIPTSAFESYVRYKNSGDPAESQYIAVTLAGTMKAALDRHDGLMLSASKLDALATAATYYFERGGKLPADQFEAIKARQKSEMIKVAQSFSVLCSYTAGSPSDISALPAQDRKAIDDNAQMLIDAAKRTEGAIAMIVSMQVYRLLIGNAANGGN